MQNYDASARAIAIDLGGTRFRVAVGTGEGDIEWRVSKLTQVNRGREAVLASIYETVDEAMATVSNRSTIKGIGIAAPGPLDPWTGVIYNPPNMPDWDAVPIKELFQTRYHIPTTVANDANLAAVGEHRYGAGRGLSHMVYVTVSTGIGGGVIADGKLLLGHRGFAGEVGHMTINMQGPRCLCGNIGCLEVLASGTAIGRRARELVLSGARTSLNRLPVDAITAKEVEEAAIAGDEVARQVMTDAGTALGVGMVNLAHLFNPQRIIIGGGVSNAGPLLWDTMRQVVRARAMPPSQQDLEIVPAGLGDDAGLLGAVAVVVYP